MSDELHIPEVVVLTEEEDWTVWIGWQKVIFQMVLRGILAAGVAMGIAAILTVSRRRGELTILMAAAGGSLQGLVLAWKLVETTGIVSRWLMVISMGVLAGGAYLAHVGLGMTSLAGGYSWYWFIYVCVVGWIVSSFRAWMDF